MAEAKLWADVMLGATKARHTHTHTPQQRQQDHDELVALELQYGDGAASWSDDDSALLSVNLDLQDHSSPERLIQAAERGLSVAQVRVYIAMLQLQTRPVDSRHKIAA